VAETEKAAVTKTPKKTPSRENQKCREKDCKHPYKAKGYCVKHYRQWRAGEVGKKQRYKICTKEACRKPRARVVSARNTQPPQPPPARRQQQHPLRPKFRALRPGLGQTLV